MGGLSKMDIVDCVVIILIGFVVLFGLELIEEKIKDRIKVIKSKAKKPRTKKKKEGAEK